MMVPSGPLDCMRILFASRQGMTKLNAARTLAGRMEMSPSPMRTMESRIARLTTTEANSAMIIATWARGFSRSSPPSMELRAVSATGRRMLEALPARKAK